MGGRDDGRQPPLGKRVTPLLGDVDKRIDGSDHRAVGAVERGRKREKEDTRAVGPLGHGFGAFDRAIFPQRDRHWAFGMVHRRPVRPVEPPRAAPPGRPQLRAHAPEIGRSIIVGGNDARGIGCVDRNRQSLEEIARTPLQRGCRQIRWRPDILKHARFLFAPRHH